MMRSRGTRAAPLSTCACTHWTGSADAEKAGTENLSVGGSIRTWGLATWSILKSNARFEIILRR